MKIDAAIRAAFTEQERIARHLRREVDRDLGQRKRTGWHYESRVKGLESFALKIETGRIQSIEAVEDVFGATLVVPDSTQIGAAIEVVLERYPLHERRPPSSVETTKSSDQFSFDDIRLYVRYVRTEGEKTEIPDAVLFEVQIKTFLQHAWAVATHDLIYKTSLRDWRRERIAHQIRAQLEQAEVVIGGIDSLSETPVLPQVDTRIAELNSIIEMIQQDWSSEDLPSDIRRLAESVQSLLKVARPNRDADRPALLRTLLDNGKARAAGAHSLDWSPYRAVLNYMTVDHPVALRKRLGTNRGPRLLVYTEILDSLSLTAGEAVGAIVIPG